mmetsp:Transcript_1644/g.3666  ORF Transcript_1644/g.3666 Transcript_1644/m.3666 type:complete len:284 (-) Transcript_1644:567-1418(-)
MCVPPRYTRAPQPDICPPAAATATLPSCGFHSSRARPAAIDSAMTVSMSFLSTGCGFVTETPMSVTMVQRMESPRFFLSSAIFFMSMLISRSRGTWTGSPYEAKQRVTRSIFSRLRLLLPMRSESSASTTQPMATHSPCMSAGDLSASMAWPTVWPQLSVPRRPASRSSAATTSALPRTASYMTLSMSSRSRAMTLLVLASSASKSAGSRMQPILIASAMPSTSSLLPSVTRQSRSAYTMCGWWKAPMRFLPAGTLIAVLPPTLESIIAVLEVGTWMYGTPRM